MEHWPEQYTIKQVRPLISTVEAQAEEIARLKRELHNIVKTLSARLDRLEHAPPQLQQGPPGRKQETETAEKKQVPRTSFTAEMSDTPTGGEHRVSSTRLSRDRRKRRTAG